MFKLDDNFLYELGLGSLPPEEKNQMLAHIYNTLELNVGMQLANQMTDAQLTEFESYVDRNDEAGALKWLETNFPNYKDVVAQELEKLKTEIRQVAPQILASAQAAQSQTSTMSQPPQQQMPAQPPLPPQQPQYPSQPPVPPQPFQTAPNDGQMEWVNPQYPQQYSPSTQQYPPQQPPQAP